MKLIIFIRKGCCICDSLKNNLRKINIKNIQPDLNLQEIDIDRFDLYNDQFKKYDHTVPVIAIQKIASNEIIELPRVSPRLKDSQLELWLRKNIDNLL